MRHIETRIMIGMKVDELGLYGFTIAAALYYRRLKVLEVQRTFHDPPGG